MSNCLFHYQTVAQLSMALSLKEVSQSVFLIESESHLVIKKFINESNGFLLCTLRQAEIQSKYASLFVHTVLGQTIVCDVLFVCVFLFVFCFFCLTVHPFMCERDLGPEK